MDDGQKHRGNGTLHERGTICSICGVASATTRDHIPPKSIFAVPRPADLITVPACEACNRDGSKYDEIFRVYLSLHVGANTPAAERLFTSGTRRTVRRNRKLRKQIFGSLERTYLTTRGGIITGKGYRCKWDSEAHDKVIERITRGLFFHHFGEVLGTRARVRVYWFRTLTPDMLEGTRELRQDCVGGDAFIYRFGRAVDGPLCSVWLFQFYGRHWAGARTGPATRADGRTVAESPVSVR